MAKTRIYVDKDIGQEPGEISATAFRLAWPSDAKEVEMIVNSAGGSCTDGIAIAEFIRARRAEGVKVEAKIIGLCGSIATMIAMAADKVEISPLSQFFIHESRCGVEGKSEDLAAAQKELELYNGMMKKVYADKTHLDEKKIEEMMAAETIMSADQAKSMGFVDSITQFFNKAVAKFKKNDATGHVYITINQAEDSPNTVQTGETESGGTDTTQKPETMASVPAPETTEVPAPVPMPIEPGKEVEEINEPAEPEETEEVKEMRAKISALEVALAEMKASNEIMHAEAAKAEADNRSAQAVKAKLAEFLPPARPKYEAVKTSTVKAHTANTMQVF